MKKRTKHFLSAIIGIGFLFIAFGSDEETMSQAEGQVSNFEVNSDFGIINDEPDAGYTITFTVKNIGKRGILTITPKLSCSEGEWTREQTLTLEAGASRNLSYFFHEPTINSTNVQGSVKVDP